MLRLLIVLSLGVQTPAWAGPDPADGSLEASGSVEALLSLSAVGAEAHLMAWREEGARRLLEHDAVLWDAEGDEERACRHERRETARRFLDALDTFGGSLTRPDVSEQGRQTAAEVLVRAWRPVAAVEAGTPCAVESAGPGQLTITPTVPVYDGLADLPELLEDDPMSLGTDRPGVRVLRR